jgi:hypothetical protein
MAMGSIMEELAGFMIAQCMNELVRRDGVDWSSIAKMVRVFDPKNVCA